VDGEHLTLQRRLDAQFHGPTGGGADTEVSGVAPTVIVPAPGARAPLPVPTPATAPSPAVSAVATWVARASGRYPALAAPRHRLGAAGVAGGIAFFLLFVFVLWVTGKVPQGEPLEAVVYSFPENFRIDLGLHANHGWKRIVARQVFSITALVPGIAAGVAGASARRRGWPGWLGMLLSALAAFAFLLPYLPPIGSYYRYDPFPLVAVAYLLAGSLAGRLGAWLDGALASPLAKNSLST
jgi:hypothetical protein